MPDLHDELATLRDHESVWIGTMPARQRAPLSEDLEVDVVVIGGGIVGVTAAYRLAQEGKNVALLERDRVLAGVTGKTTAKVSAQQGVQYLPLVKRFDRPTAQRHARAVQEAQQEVARLIKRIGVDADYTQESSYVYTQRTEHVETLRKEAETAIGLGLPAVFTTETELPFPIEGAVRFDDQAHFHPRKYLLKLLERAEAKGCQVYENTPVETFQDGTQSTVKTPEATVKAGNVVVATHVPIRDRLFFVHRMRPKREYALAATVTDPSLSGMYVNHESPRRSVRPYVDDEDGPMLIFAGEDHPTGARGEDHHFDRLEGFARDHFPVGEVKYRWSTQDYHPYDDLPLIGRFSPTSKGTYAATGFRAWGMTQGTLAAMILTDVIVGRKNPWQDLYDPHRANRVVRNTVDPEAWKTGVHVVKEYVVQRMTKDRLEDLRPGEGQVADQRGQKVAVARDEDGRLHKLSAKCAHMGCIVAYNKEEKSWDCPCHGARYALNGAPLRGPSVKGLERLE